MANKKAIKKVNKKDQNNRKLILTIFTLCIYVFWLIFLSSTKITILNFLVNFIFLGVMIFLYRDDLRDNFIKLKNQKRKILYFFLLFIGFIIILCLSNLLISILLTVFGYDIINGGASNNEIFKIFTVIPWGALFASFLTIFFYPIVEELVFRKSLGDVIKNKFLFVVISSLLYWYFQVTILKPTLLEMIIGMGALLNGIYASIIYIKTKGNIFYTIIPRMLFNVLICAIQIIQILSM